MPIVDPVQTPGLAQFLTDTAFDPAQSHRDIDAFLATRPGGHTISDIVADGLYDPRLEVLESIARTSEHPEGCRYGMAGRTAFARAVVHAMACAGVDALLYPNTRMLPPLACEVAEGRWTHATFPTNAGIAVQSDLPSVCIPAGFTDTGVPVGADLLGPPFNEADLLRLAHHYERALRRRRSPQLRHASSRSPGRNCRE